MKPHPTKQYSQVLSEKEFNERAKRKGIVVTRKLWNMYVDKVWRDIEIEFGIDNSKRVWYK